MIFVLFSKLFEAYAANGVRNIFFFIISGINQKFIFFEYFIAILALYMKDELNFSEVDSTSFFHAFNFLSQFCPIVGAIIADSYMGNVKLIFYTFFAYACGWIGIVVLTIPLENTPML